jgi:hypothetical protein
MRHVWSPTGRQRPCSVQPPHVAPALQCASISSLVITGAAHVTMDCIADVHVQLPTPCLCLNVKPPPLPPARLWWTKCDLAEAEAVCKSYQSPVSPVVRVLGECVSQSRHSRRSPQTLRCCLGHGPIQPPSSNHLHTTHLPHHRPYGRHHTPSLPATLRLPGRSGGSLSSTHWPTSTTLPCKMPCDDARNM